MKRYTCFASDQELSLFVHRTKKSMKRTFPEENSEKILLRICSANLGYTKRKLSAFIVFTGVGKGNEGCMTGSLGQWTPQSHFEVCGSGEREMWAACISADNVVAERGHCSNRPQRPLGDQPHAISH